jgi:hypothetical protein
MPISDDKAQVAVIMSKELKEALKTYAETHHWSLSQAAALLIQEGINHWKLDQSDKTYVKKLEEADKSQ